MTDTTMKGTTLPRLSRIARQVFMTILVIETTPSQKASCTYIFKSDPRVSDLVGAVNRRGAVYPAGIKN